MYLRELDARKRPCADPDPFTTSFPDLCLASDCFHWQWTDFPTRQSPTDFGYCKLSPQVAPH